MSKKPAGAGKPPSVADVARIKSGHDKKAGGKTPLPAHVRRLESAAAKDPSKEGR
jgi:hypothetical protein